MHLQSNIIMDLENFWMCIVYCSFIHLLSPLRSIVLTDVFCPAVTLHTCHLVLNICSHPFYTFNFTAYFLRSYKEDLQLSIDLLRTRAHPPTCRWDNPLGLGPCQWILEFGFFGDEVVTPSRCVVGSAQVGTELLQDLTGRPGNWIWAFWHHLAFGLDVPKCRPPHILGSPLISSCVIVSSFGDPSQTSRPSPVMFGLGS